MGFIPWIIGAGIVGVIGYSTNEAGEGVDKAGNGIAKALIVATAAYVIYKKVK